MFVRFCLTIMLCILKSAPVQHEIIEALNHRRHVQSVIVHHKKAALIMVAPDKKTLKKSVKSMFFMVQTRCEVETIKY